MLGYGTGYIGHFLGWWPIVQVKAGWIKEQDEIGHQLVTSGLLQGAVLEPALFSLQVVDIRAKKYSSVNKSIDK